MPIRLHPSRGSTPAYSVTTVRASAAQDRHQREVRYLLAMAFRMICFAGALVTTGWVRWTAVAVAVVMPWIAVVLANNRGTPTHDRVDPGAARGLGMSSGGGTSTGTDSAASRPCDEGPLTGVLHLPDTRHTDPGLRTGAPEKNNG